MIVELLEQLFSEGADIVDLDTWCRCHVACKRVNQHMMSRQCRNLNFYEFVCKQTEAARLAKLIVSLKPWSEEDPRCCSLHCRNSFNKKTGIYCPPHVIFISELPQGVSSVSKILWWKNKPAARYYYKTTTPQEKLTTIIEQARHVHEVKYHYVACSESCLYDIKPAAEAIHWRNKQELQVLLGIEILPRRWVDWFYISDSETESDSFQSTASQNSETIR